MFKTGPEKKEFRNVFSAIKYRAENGFRGPIVDSETGEIIIDTQGCWKKDYDPAVHLTTKECAYLLGISSTRMYQFCRKGRIKAVKFGKAWSIALADLEEFASIERKSGRAGWNEESESNFKAAKIKAAKTKIIADDTRGSITRAKS